MNTANTNTLNNTAIAASLLGCAALSIAMLLGTNNTAPQTSQTLQTMEPIVITAKRMQTIQLATIEITAKRLTSTSTSAPAMQTVALAPMVIVAKRITV